LGKPLILSDTAALREYFDAGAVYTENTAECIASAIGYAIQNKDRLKKEVLTFRCEWKERWQRKLLKLESILSSLS
jgi:hypothetical protein